MPMAASSSARPAKTASSIELKRVVASDRASHWSIVRTSDTGWSLSMAWMALATAGAIASGSPAVRTVIVIAV